MRKANPRAPKTVEKSGLGGLKNVPDDSTNLQNRARTAPERPKNGQEREQAAEKHKRG